MHTSILPARLLPRNVHGRLLTIKVSLIKWTSGFGRRARRAGCRLRLATEKTAGCTGPYILVSIQCGLYTPRAVACPALVEHVPEH
ncbi:hypothetical protein K466DRAFT_588540 [Polyporus arcularius HHB13444]|uniref:Uncharacterized protein n=1 Tax=Polyporus arcularius HHB13444 TaxID=1314778 RepID=A0A5C3P5Y2_9APHY|nr:hypothetical protein K466DRAFT_588540 [Polyporus arcularius HHB13444]